MTAPLAELLRARARALRAEADLLDGIAEQADAPAVDGFSQDNRPAWIGSRVVFLRAWRIMHGEGHPGVSAHGKLRVMSREAALAWRDRTATEPRKKAPAVEPVAASNDVGFRD